MSFDGPIPGQSLTRPPGNAPYEKPPMHTDLDKTMDRMVGRILDENNSNKLLALMDNGVPVTTIVGSLLMTGFTEGHWSPDLAVMLAQPIAATLMAMADNAGVKYEQGTPKDDTLQYLTKLAALSGQNKMAQAAGPTMLDPSQSTFGGPPATQDAGPAAAEPTQGFMGA